jgi:hypothetical protein
MRLWISTKIKPDEIEIFNTLYEFYPELKPETPEEREKRLRREAEDEEREAGLRMMRKEWEESKKREEKELKNMGATTLAECRDTVRKMMKQINELQTELEQLKDQAAMGGGSRRKSMRKKRGRKAGSTRRH